MDILLRGGPVMGVLALFSVFFLALIFYCRGEYGRLRNPRGPYREKINALMEEGETPEEAFDEVSYPLRRGIAWLSHLANLSTLLGLLGTVLGVHNAFRELEAAREVSMKIFAGGIHQAVLTTIVGLSLAIPALIGHYFFRDKFSRIEARILKDILKRMDS